MKMIKSKIAPLFLSGLLLVISSCIDQLDIAPDGRLTLDEIFEDNEKVAAFLNSIYIHIPKKGKTEYHGRGPVVWCDDAWDADEFRPGAWGSDQSGLMYAGNVDANHTPIRWYAENIHYWDTYWEAIQKCNIFLSRIDEAAVTNDANRRRWKAEAQILRAWFYAELLRWHGTSIPISKEPYSYNQDFSELERKSYYEVVQFILEDCNEAINTAQLPWRITSSAEAGRVTKALAEAIKSRMILYAASTLYNEGNNYWQEAYTVNKQSLQQLKSSGYELYKEVNYPAVYLSADAHFGPLEESKRKHAAIYNEYFTNEMRYATDPVDKETIYQDWRNHQGALYNLEGPAQGVRSGPNPSQEIVDAYETIDGITILNLDNPYADARHTTPNFNPANTLYNEQDPYQNRDPRFYASVYYNGSKRKAFWPFAETVGSFENYPAAQGNRVRTIATYVGEPRSGIHINSRHQTRTGYYIRKFLHPTSGNDNVIHGARWKHFRLGEVILNFAEAAAEHGQLEEARTAVNEIRQRAGIPNLPTGLSKDELILRIRNERRIELAFEEYRYFDVRRWTAPDGDLSATDRWVTAAEITRNTDGTYSWIRRPVSTERRCYTNKFLKGPIPLDEANRLKGITGVNWQNPGW